MKYCGRRSHLDEHIIRAVKEKRIYLGIPQVNLARRMGLSDAFIGHVENPKKKAKYNLNHLNKLAEIFHCSIADFLPLPYLTNNEIDMSE